MTEASDRVPGGYLCPACGAGMTPLAPCPRCGRGPDAQAPRLVALDSELAGLATRIEASRQRLAEMDQEWRTKSAERHDIARAMMAAVAAERARLAPAPVAMPVGQPVRAAMPAMAAGMPAGMPGGFDPVAERDMPWAGAGRAGTADASPRTIQNLLFVLGGILLGIGAIVFTVVAWAHTGIAGKMAILATATAVALAVPVVSMRRGLRATAETFAAIGLLLVFLDAYGFRALDRADIGVSSPTYWGLVLAGLAVLAALYGPAVGLAGPRFVAVIVAQPVIPVLVAAHSPESAAVAAAFAATAILDLAYVAALARTSAPAAGPLTSALRVCAGVFGGLALTVATAFSSAGMALPDDIDVAANAGVFALCALVLFAGTARLREPILRTMGVGAAVLGVTIAAMRVMSLAWPGHPLEIGTVATAFLAAFAYATKPAARPASVPTAIAPAASTPATGPAPTLATGAAPAPVAGAAPTPAAGADAAAVAASAPAAVVAAGPATSGHSGAATAGVTGSTGSPDVAATAGTPAGARPDRVRTGFTGAFGSAFAAAAWVATGILALAAGLPALRGLVARLAMQTPWWTSPLTRADHAWTVTVTAPIALAVVVAATATLAARRERGRIALAGVVPVTLALGVIDGIRWWMPAALDVTVTAGILAVAVVAARRGRSAGTVVGAAAALLLAVHAALVAQARPALSGAVLGALAVLAAGLVVATYGRREPADKLLGCGGLAVGIVALPLAVASAVAAAVDGPVWPMRAAMAAVALGVVAGVAVRRREDLRGYVTVPLTVIAILVALSPLAFGGHERLNLYAMTGRLLIALAVLAVGLRGPAARRAMLPGDALGVLAFGRIVPLLVTVAVLPYGWLDHVWAGAPRGVGLTPGALPWQLDSLDMLTAGLAAASLTAGGLAWRGRRGAVAFAVPSTVVAVLVVLAVAGAPWPLVPAVALAAGAGIVLVDAVVRPVGVPATLVGLVVAGAGLAALAAAKPSTLIGLGVVVVVSTVVGWAGRSVTHRATGFAVAAVSADLLVVAAMKAGDVGVVAYGLLGVAALTSVAAPLLRRAGRDRAETRVLDAIAQAGAFVALAVSGTLVRAAICAAAWGVLVGVRALWPDVTVAPRRVLVSAAAGLELLAWWLVAADRGIHLVDAYTVPLAAVALFAGWQAARTRPELSSWVAYGPALLALFGPGIAPAVGSDPSIARRLVIGALAIAVVLLGARTRLQAPVVVGSVALLILAAHELVVAWQKLPAWIPLTAAGLLVIAVAATYERRRRDWRNLRGMVGRLS